MPAPKDPISRSIWLRNLKAASRKIPEVLVGRRGSNIGGPDGIDVCLEQVKRGYAWHYKKYQSEQSLEDQRLYANAENKARNERLGLWQENNPNLP